MEHYLTPSAALFSVGIFILTFIVRRMVEGLFPTLSKHTPPSRAQQIWEETILRILPPLLGLGLSFVMSDMMHPEMSAKSRVWFGMVCGFFSTYAYMIVKSVLRKMFPGLKDPTGREGDSLQPGSTSDAPPKLTVTVQEALPVIDPPADDAPLPRPAPMPPEEGPESEP